MRRRGQMMVEAALVMVLLFLPVLMALTYWQKAIAQDELNTAAYVAARSMVFQQSHPTAFSVASVEDTLVQNVPLKKWGVQSFSYSIVGNQVTVTSSVKSLFLPTTWTLSKTVTF